MRAPSTRVLIAIAALAVACGDDGGGGAKKPKPAGGAKKGPAKKAAATPGGTTIKAPKARGKQKAQAALDVYMKIEDLCPTPDEAEKPQRIAEGCKDDGKKPAEAKPDQKTCDYRRVLTDADFQPDPSGDLNRDPFRSYVVRQGVVNAEASHVAVQETDTCKDDNSKATTFLLRDLRLIGIVLKGTRSYALFRDKAQMGWTVHRGDCLGKEKAVVQSIGVGSVVLLVKPEAPPQGTAPEPTKQEIALYPEDLDPYEALANPRPETESTEPTDTTAPPPEAAPSEPAPTAPPPQ
jgi:Tfp pilus assembly protein PilP